VIVREKRLRQMISDILSERYETTQSSGGKSRSGSTSVRSSKRRAGGEGTIDGKSVKDWLADFWRNRKVAHLGGLALDFQSRGKPWMRDLVQTQVSQYITNYEAIDETKNAGPHWHLQLTGDSALTPEGETLIANMTDLTGLGGTSHLDDVESQTLALAKIVYKLAKDQGKTPVITSGKRSPEHQAELMISNWNDNGGRRGGRMYITRLYRRMGDMAKKVDSALAGGTVDSRDPSTYAA
jgi:hypothetical protein